MKGSYTLLIELSEDVGIELGSLGELKFEKGFYAYNGSAFGPGGLKRVERHREKSRGGGSTHWHVDYLLVSSVSEIVGVFKAGSDHECELSKEMIDRFDYVDGFGSSDCGCRSHLFCCSERIKIEEFLDGYYRDSESL
jgi:endonuclease-3